MWMTKQFDTKQRVGERSELRAEARSEMAISSVI